MLTSDLINVTLPWKWAIVAANVYFSIIENLFGYFFCLFYDFFYIKNNISIVINHYF